MDKHIHIVNWTSQGVGEEMGYILLFLIGFGLAIIGGVSLIFYLNLLPVGLSWLDYFTFISGRIECYFFPIGLLFMWITLFRFSNNS